MSNAMRKISIAQNDFTIVSGRVTRKWIGSVQLPIMLCKRSQAGVVFMKTMEVCRKDESCYPPFDENIWAWDRMSRSLHLHARSLTPGVQIDDGQREGFALNMLIKRTDWRTEGNTSERYTCVMPSLQRHRRYFTCCVSRQESKFQREEL